MTDVLLSNSDILERIESLKKEIQALEKEHKLLEFDLKEMQDLNNNLSTEIDRLYQNISYLAETESIEE